MAYRRRGTRRVKRRRVRKTRRSMRTRTSFRGRRTRRFMGSANKVYTLMRQTEVTMYNDANGATNPYLPLPTSTDSGYLTPVSTDVTGYTAPQCVNFGFSINDKLNSLQNITEFSNVFEYVRIVKIVRKFVPVYHSQAIVSGAAQDLVGTVDNYYQEAGLPTPTLLVYPDRDSNEPVTSAFMREAMGGRRIKMTGTFTDSWKPKIALPIGQTTGGPSIFMGVKSMPWANFTDALTVQVYGRRYGVLDWPKSSNAELPAAVPYAWRIYSTYTLQFKGAK